MCLRDLIAALIRRGLNASEGQIRWSIAAGKVSRPPLDGSLRFDFQEEHVEEIASYLHQRAIQKASGSA